MTRSASLREIPPALDASFAPSCGVKHLGIIMDGNGRWAEQRGLPRIQGHEAGADAVDRIVEAGRRLGLQALTLYTFSTENWRRPFAEVNALFDLLTRTIAKQADRLVENGIRFCTIGELSPLPNLLLEELDALKQRTSSNSTMILTLALNYGGRDELVRSFQRLATQVCNGELAIEEIDEHSITRNLDTYQVAELPDPDLIVRTAGELRLSNFLLWQCAYSEFFASDTLWPDFDSEDLQEAMRAFAGRTRRFGGLPAS